MKTCTKCGIEKDLSQFYPDPRYRGGYRHCCKFCKNEADRKANFRYRIKLRGGPPRTSVHRSSRRLEDRENRILWRREHRSEDVLRRRIKRFFDRELKTKALTPEEELAKLIKEQAKDDATICIKYEITYDENASKKRLPPHTVYYGNARIV